MLLSKNMSNLKNKKMDKEKIAEKVFDHFTDDFQINIETILHSYYKGDDKDQIVELVLNKVGKLYGSRFYKKPHKTIELVVSNDYNSDYAWLIYKEGLQNCAEDLDIIVKHQNDRNMHVLKDWDKLVSMDYKYNKVIKCTGYSQGDWDTYTIYYKVWNDQTQLLADLLSKLYTHKNDYIVEVNEILDSDHSKYVDTFCFTINDVEFPDNDRIREEIDQYCTDHDIKFNKIVYNLNNSGI